MGNMEEEKPYSIHWWEFSYKEVNCQNQMGAKNTFATISPGLEVVHCKQIARCIVNYDNRIVW